MTLQIFFWKIFFLRKQTLFRVFLFEKCREENAAGACVKSMAGKQTFFAFFY
jgi:hypothetical protein